MCVCVCVCVYVVEKERKKECEREKERALMPRMSVYHDNDNYNEQGDEDELLL